MDKALLEQLAEINAQIELARAAIPAKKIKAKLDKMKLCHKTAHKYYSLQELYMNTVRGIK